MSANSLADAVMGVDNLSNQMRKVVESLARIDWPQLRRALNQLEGYDQHHPRPLEIDGHEYARRRRNR